MILVIGGIKGGTGKTTLATNLAVLSSFNGKNVLLVDADEQESATDWAQQREERIKSNCSIKTNTFVPPFPTIQLTGKFIFEQINRLKRDYDTVVVDTGGRDTTSQRSSLVGADFFIIPFKPRSLDVWTIDSVINLIREVRSLNPNLKVIVCVNQADARGSDNEDVIDVLREIEEFECATTTIGHRKAFANAASVGMGVSELPNRDIKAYDEIYSLYYMIYPQDIKNV